MKLIEVTVPPKDGTEFVAVWISDGERILNDRFKIVHGVLFYFCTDSLSYEKACLCYWSEENVKFFVVGE